MIGLHKIYTSIVLYLKLKFTENVNRSVHMELFTIVELSKKMGIV